MSWVLRRSTPRCGDGCAVSRIIVKAGITVLVLLGIGGRFEAGFEGKRYEEFGGIVGRGGRDSSFSYSAQRAGA